MHCHLGLSSLCLLVVTACTADTTVTEGSTESDDSLSSESSDDPSDESSTDTETDESESDTETTATPPECGDAVTDADEECDDGNFVDDDACTNACLLPACGDGLVQAGEGCDTGANNGPGQLCNGSCQPNVCGDADVGPGESCDDGNQVDADECPNDCVIASCGNGVVDAGEECEDGDQDDGDGCTNACLFPICGDAVVWVGHESCDDGNAFDDDDCTTSCEFAACGDGVVQGEEECEDGNELANDGCFTCLEQRVVSIAAGEDNTCAVLEGGALRCWGWNYFGELGYGNFEDVGDDESPASVGDLDVGGPVVQVSSSGSSTCAVFEDGGVRCWGSDYGRPFNGNLGYPSGPFQIGDDETPSSVGYVNVGGPVQKVEPNYGQFTCALLVGGTVRCWGLWQYLGYAGGQNIGDDEDPAVAGDVDIGGVVVDLGLGYAHACALLETGSVRCWGYVNAYGNTAFIGDDEVPASAGDVDVGGVVVELAVGGYHTCARLDTGGVRCWGKNDYGQLGYGHTSTIGDNEVPASAGDVPIGEPAVQIAAGVRHTCALLETGAVRCWGLGSNGRLGYGNTNTIGDNEAPASAGDVDIGGGAVQAVVAGEGHTCALMVSGVARCWGANAFGQLGLASETQIGDNELPATAGNVQVY